MVRAPQACSHEESTPPKFSGTGPPPGWQLAYPTLIIAHGTRGHAKAHRLQHWDPHSLTLPPSHHARRSDFQMPAASAT